MTILAEHGPWALFFAFAIAHALADYPLQGEWLAKHKARGGPDGGDWWLALAAHSLIHAGGVWLVSGNPILAAVELAAHMLIDHGKGAGWYGLKTDQLLHLLCKAVYVSFMVLVLNG